MSGLGVSCTSPFLLLLAATVLACCLPANGLKASDIVVVVLSQEGEHHVSQAQQLKDDIKQQAALLKTGVPVVHLTHEDFLHPGAWTVMPIIPRLHALHGTNSSWLFFSESYTKLHLEKIIQLLEEYDPLEIIWIGHALYDREASIIHHFAFYENPGHFKYPNFASGFAMSNSLIKRLASQINNYAAPTDFSIDPAHELALFIWNKDNGPRITHSPKLCLTKSDQCASYPITFKPCGDPVNKRSIYFAVKTCKRFHDDRIPVVKKTWAKYVTNIGFYSEITDDSIPTIDLGIPNTERGHCGKTFALLKHTAVYAAEHPNIKWVIVVDDDTILSVARLQQLLSCYNASHPIAIGERYGYNVQHSIQGYNYITGGGGMVLSARLIQMIVKSKHCKCPSPTTPDDMFLGMCLTMLGVPITHSPLFHQARPTDYAPEYLEAQIPVSFHKHWMIDPIRVYDNWFADADKQFEEIIQAKHIEL